MEEWKNGHKAFEYIYQITPIDFWDNALVPSMEEEFRVLTYMPEEPRNGFVYKLYVPYPDGGTLEPIFLCKAENNGTTYIFSDVPVAMTTDYFERIK